MLNLYHLKYFCDSCRLKSMSAAAELNRVSHSAVSQAIRSLESALDTELLIHARRQFELTESGSALYHRAEQALADFESLSRVVHTDQTAISGQLRLGFSQSIWNGLLKTAVPSFVKAHSALQLSVSLGNSTVLAELLHSRKIDLGFGIEDGSFVGLERTLIRKGRFIVATRKTNAKAISNRFFVGDKGQEVRDLLAGLEKKKVVPEINYIQSWSMIAQLAHQGLGNGLVPDFCVEADSKIASILPDLHLPKYEVYAFYRNRLNLSSAAAKLMDRLSDQ